VVDLHRLDEVRVEARLGAALAILILSIARQRDESQRLRRRMPQLHGTLAPVGSAALHPAAHRESVMGLIRIPDYPGARFGHRSL